MFRSIDIQKSKFHKKKKKTKFIPNNIRMTRPTQKKQSNTPPRLFFFNLRTFSEKHDVSVYMGSQLRVALRGSLGENTGIPFDL